MKLCNTCSTTKPREEFQKRVASKDGLSAKCKPCASAYDKSRANYPHRIAIRQAYATTERGVERGNAAKIAYISREPKKVAAHTAVANAVRDGKLIKKPCEVCGDTYKIHAHHDDYNAVYEVRWLCSKHHREWHRINGEAPNGR